MWDVLGSLAPADGDRCVWVSNVGERHKMGFETLTSGTAVKLGASSSGFACG